MATPIFVFRLDDKQRARIKAAALLRGCTESEVVRDLVRRAKTEDLVFPSSVLVGAKELEAKAESRQPVAA